ncbi:MAG: hypothetical protein KAT05_15725, partial [Spirochaetes bacterium]|nr:hypothetical protein [Spirochaetota bacterium]
VSSLKIKKPKNIILRKIKIKNEIRKNAKKLLEGEKNLVGVHACNKLNYKVWPRDKFVKIIEFLIKEKKKSIVLLGSDNEKKDNEKLIESVNKKFHSKIIKNKMKI